MRTKLIHSNGGFMLTEAVVGMFVLACIMGGVMLALRAQTEAAERILTRTRCRLLLEGELEIMRGLSESRIRACRNARFEPTMGIPDGLEDVDFRKTVRRQEDDRLVLVILQAMKERGEETIEWMSIESVIFAEGGMDER
jgi:hypothetical protein